MRRKTKDLLSFIALLIALTCITFVFMAGLLYLVAGRGVIERCEAAGQAWGLESRWTFPGGCALEVTPGVWVPAWDERYFGSGFSSQ